MKRKNDYYYIIKLGIFQRKSQLAKDGFGLLTKKKKSFMIFV